MATGADHMHGCIEKMYAFTSVGGGSWGAGQLCTDVAGKVLGLPVGDAPARGDEDRSTTANSARPGTSRHAISCDFLTLAELLEHRRDPTNAGEAHDCVFAVISGTDQRAC